MPTTTTVLDRAEAKRNLVQAALERLGTILPGRGGKAAPALQSAEDLDTLAATMSAVRAELQELEGLLTNKDSWAEAHFNRVQPALEEGSWDDALDAIRQAATFAPERFAPFPLNTFVPQEILGASPLGVTFLCRPRNSQARVVIKSLRPAALGQSVPELAREAAILGELEHPALPRVLSCDYADAGRTRPYLVREHFDGHTLADHVRRHGPLDPGDWWPLARALAEALGAAHARGVLHRSFKPSNLLVRQEGTRWHVKVVDFGLAVKSSFIQNTLGRPAQEVSPLDRAHAAALIEYAPLEQLGWVGGGTVGPPSDVYGFGKCCYYALLGTPEPDGDEREKLNTSWRRLLGSCTTQTADKRLTDFGTVLDRLNLFPAEDRVSFRAKVSRPVPAPVTDEGRPETAGVAGEERDRVSGEAAPEAGRAMEVPGEMEAGADAEAAATYYRQGLALARQGEHDQAIAAFTEANRLDPTNVLAWINRGVVYRLKEEFDLAIADYAQAICLDPQNPLGYLNRGIVYRLQGNLDRAIADYSEAVRRDPDNPQPVLYRGVARAERGEMEPAIADFSETLRLDPENVAAFYHRGGAYLHKGDYDRCVADFTDVLRLKPDYTPVFATRGTAYLEKNDWDRAIADFTNALKHDGPDAVILQQRGYALYRRKNYDLAIKDLSYALRLDSQRADAYLYRGLAQSARGNPDQAIADLGEAVRLNPENAETHAALGVAYRAQRRFGQAIASFTRALDLDHSLVSAATERAVCYRLKGDQDRAIAELTEVLARGPANAKALAERGMAHFAAGNLDAAVADAQEALRLDPKLPLPHPHFIQGAAHLQVGDYSPALTAFTQALNHDPEFTQAYYHRGLVQVHVGDQDAAIADFTETLKRNPRLAAAYVQRGTVQQLKEDHEAAIKDFEQALRWDPDNAEASYNRGVCLHARGEYDAATQAFAQTLRTQPDNQQAYSARIAATRAKEEREREERARLQEASLRQAMVKVETKKAKTAKKQGRDRKLLRVLAAAAIVAVVGGGLYFGLQNLRGSGPTMMVVSPADLCDQYIFEPALAESFYTAKVIQVTGSVSEIRKDPSGKTLLVFKSGRQKKWTVECEFVPEDMEALGNLQVGKTVSVIGRCRGRENADAPVQLEECRFPKQA